MTVGADPMIPHAHSVRLVRQDTHDTFTIELDPVKANENFSFAPGQFNMVYMYGVGEIPISISGDPTKPFPIVHTTRAVGTVTNAMHKLRKGDVVGVRGPFGSSWPVEDAKGEDVVIVAGGIGLAPLRPALYKLLSERDKYGKIVLLYGTRSPTDILYRKELQKWRSHFDLDIYVTVDRAMGGWRGNVGVVTTLISKAPFDPLSTRAMVCGPEIMMRFTVSELLKRGIAEENVSLSLERNMKCGIGFCGHCQYGPEFICKDGPVFTFDKVKDLFEKREI